MIRLEPIRPFPRKPLPRLWLVFFRDGVCPTWWHRLLRPGFRHVCAAAWYDLDRRWVFVDPARLGTAIELYDGADFEPMLGHLAQTSAAILRVRSEFARSSTPAFWHCVGAMKALLGIKSRALVPAGLYRDLLRRGAEIVEVPSRGEHIRGRPHTTGRGPGSESAAGPGGGACADGTDSRDPGSARTGNAAA